MSLSQNLSRSVELFRCPKTHKLGKICVTRLLFRRWHVTEGELELEVTTATKRVQKMTPKTSTCVAVTKNMLRLRM